MFINHGNTEQDILIFLLNSLEILYDISVIISNTIYRKEE